jgi:hypothetical protein
LLLNNRLLLFAGNRKTDDQDHHLGKRSFQSGYYVYGLNVF